MKKTKEIENEENSMDKILKFDSLEDSRKFEEYAKGRKFCKVGERLQDICNDELENQICKNSKNIFLKIHLHNKLKRNRDLLENRLSRVTRNVAVKVINNQNKEDIEDLPFKVKETILFHVEKYKEKVITK